MTAGLRRHDATVALRSAVAEHGPNSSQARDAAIEFCHAFGIDPHWRHAIYPAMSDRPLTDSEAVLPRPVSAVSEWERIVKKAAARQI